MIDETEAAIAARLEKLTAFGIAVERLPEVKDELKRAVDQPRVSVCYTSSKYDDPASIGVTNQEETMSFSVVVRARRLRTRTGVYALIYAVRALLFGFKPTDRTSRIWLMDQRFEEFDADNVWRYTLNIATTAIAVVQDPAAVEVLIQELTAYWTPEGPPVP